MTDHPFVTFDPTEAPAVIVADLDERILAARRVQWNASQMNNARGVAVTERILESLYAERDAIVADHPSADYEGRVLGARRRTARR